MELEGPALRLWLRACGLVAFVARPPPSLIAANHVSRRRESSLSSRVRSPGTSGESGCPAVTDGLDARRRRTTMARRREGESLHLPADPLWFSVSLMTCRDALTGAQQAAPLSVVVRPESGQRGQATSDANTGAPADRPTPTPG